MIVSPVINASYPKIVKLSAMFFALGLSQNALSQPYRNNINNNDSINHSIWDYTFRNNNNDVCIPYYNFVNFTKENKTTVEITKEGVSAAEGVEFPSNIIEIAGKSVKASIVIDLEKNVLYTYDSNGNPQKAYLVASGKKSTPTKKGIRRVSHFELYPYRTAPKGTKRRKNPKAYGPKIICLNVVDPSTGKTMGSNGQFIHGNNNPKSIGKYWSKGCIRMDNNAILEVADNVSVGDYVLIK